jgi:hypothetical protein
MQLINLGDEATKYERVYIPKFLYIPKKKLEHFVFIKTIDAGSGRGHIIMGGGNYYLCLRQDDCISVEERTMMPMGFRAKTIAELEALVKTFTVASKNAPAFSYNTSARKWNRTVEPPRLDYTVPWHVRCRGHYIINVVTGEEVHLGLSKPEISAKTSRLTYHLIDCIVLHGYECLNWVYKGTRLDGDTWEQYFEKRAKKHYKQTVHYSSLRRTADEIGTSHETLRQLLHTGATEVGNFKIIYCDPS